MIFNIETNQRSEFTRRCFADTVILLLKDTSFEKIKISDVVKRAGISRTTFYSYYTSIYDVLTDYLDIIVSEYLTEGRKDGSENKFFSYSHILFSFEFFDRYADFFLTLAKNNLHSVMINGINEFMVGHILLDENMSIYELYSYAGAILNTFIKWEESGKKERATDIAKALEKRFLKSPDI